jgi:hypothetical protein
MAKFFPFIVEKSSPTYIFQAIISRSKGINTLLVGSIFHLIMERGIDEIRTVTKTLPDSMGIAQIYDELMTQYPAFRISEKTYGIFQEMSRYLKIEGFNNFVGEELNEYSHKDIMLFLLVLTLVKKEDLYTELNLKPFITDAYIDASNQLKIFNLFYDSSPHYLFDSKEDLRGYFNFYGIATGYREKIYPVKAVLVDSTSKDTWESNMFLAKYTSSGDKPSDGYSDEKYGEQTYSEEEYSKAKAYAEEAKAEFDKVTKEYYEQTRSKEELKNEYEGQWNPDSDPDPKKGAQNPDRKNVTPKPSQKNPSTDPRSTLPKRRVPPANWEM